MRYEWGMAPTLGRFEPLVWWVGQLAIGVAIAVGIIGIRRPGAAVVGVVAFALWTIGMFVELRQRRLVRR
jgi:hypothetical protein